MDPEKKKFERLIFPTKYSSSPKSLSRLAIIGQVILVPLPWSPITRKALKVAVPKGLQVMGLLPSLKLTVRHRKSTFSMVFTRKQGGFHGLC